MHPDGARILRCPKLGDENQQLSTWDDTNWQFRVYGNNALYIIGFIVDIIGFYLPYLVVTPVVTSP